MMLPLVCDSVGAKIAAAATAAIDGRSSTGATVHMAEGAWEQEQE